MLDTGKSPWFDGLSLCDHTVPAENRVFVRRREGELFFLGHARALELQRARAFAEKMAKSAEGLAYLRAALRIGTPDTTHESAEPAEIIEAVSKQLVSGRLILIAKRPLEADVPPVQGTSSSDSSSSQSQDSAAEPAKSETASSKNSDEAAATEEAQDEAVADVDQEEQAATLAAAAEDGAPFCEECAKAAAEQQAESDDMPENIDAAAQAATLTAAAEEGAPFCEECEKAKKAA